MKKAQTLHDIVVEKYNKGQVLIRFNRSCLLTNYAKISRNPLIKLFHVAVWLCTFPLTIIIFASYFLYFRQFVYLACYVGGVVVLLALEHYVSQRVTIGRALRNREAFSFLLKKGVITVHDAAEPDSPL